MMVMTAKFNFKKIIMVLGAAAAVLLSLILLMDGGKDAAPASAPSMEENTARVSFLKDMGWQVKTQPVQAGKVKMPRQTSAVYERYNNLQKSQGYDLMEYAGKKAMRYVYEVVNYPDATEPVFATLLIYGGRVIGGDITDTSMGGKIRGLQRTGKASGSHHAVPAPSELPTQAPAEPPMQETSSPEASHEN